MLWEFCCLFLLATAASVSSKQLHTAGPPCRYDYKKDSPKGPSNWGRLSSDWSVCNNGSSQSPIDITSALVVRDKSLIGLDDNYNNHSLATPDAVEQGVVNMGAGAGFLSVNGVHDYSLVQVRYHIPSEHLVDGKRFLLEVQLVHNSTKAQRAAVVALFYDAGRTNDFVHQLLNVLQHNNAGMDRPRLNPKLLKVHGRPYYEYTGSLTAPPCSEGVTWYIIKKRRRASAEQIYALASITNGTNARPPQPMNNRAILSYK